MPHADSIEGGLGLLEPPGGVAVSTPTPWPQGRVFPAAVRAPGKVLLVDDEALSRQFLQAVLAVEGYELHVAEAGARALEIARQIHPDVVVLDVVMPDMSGYDVCRKLRADPSLQQVPILLLTALDDRASRLRGLEDGADDFLHKPIDPIELRTRLRTILRLNRFRLISDERARFETAVAHSPDGIVLTDLAGGILHANPAFQRLLAFPIKSIFACFPEEQAVRLRSQIASLEAPGDRIGSFETPLRQALAPGISVDVTVVRLPGPAAGTLEFIVRDITDHKKLETQLLRAQRIDLLRQLAGGIVHDVNNILAVISGRAALLADKATGPGLSELQAIQENAFRGSALLRRILMFARGSDFSPRLTDAAAVLRAAGTMSTRLASVPIDVTIEAPPGLPQVLGDEDQLHQVVMNLCVNACDAMPMGGGLHLEIRGQELTPAAARELGGESRAGRFLALSVRDTGTGIPPELRPRLFDPFFTTKPPETATGLGLATVLRIVRRHRGFITVDSAIGAGTCFTCYLPVAEPDPPQPEDAPPVNLP